MFTKVCVLSLLAVLAAAPPPPHPAPSYHAPVEHKGMPFNFAYAVKDDYSGNDFAHDESSDGKVTSGSYRVLLPDGRTQIVTFTADHYNGYVANVAYEGVAAYPAPAPYKAPAAYGPPPPAYGH